jgi:cysteine desulfurase
VLHAAAWSGRPTQVVPVDRVGRVDRAALLTAYAEHESPWVVAVQAANHEVGTVQHVPAPPEDVAVFVDACASMGRLPLPQHWAALAGSAHKWGGPAGVGVLLVRHRAAWDNPFPADDRGDHRSTGFENVPAALAAAAALQAVVADRDEVTARQHALVDRIRAAAAAIDDVDVLGDPVDRLPHLVTFSVLYVNGERLVTELDRRGFGVASGSACTASTLEPSRVLAAMGALTHGNLRVSLTRDTTAADVDAFCAVLPEVVAGLRS